MSISGRSVGVGPEDDHHRTQVPAKPAQKSRVEPLGDEAGQRGAMVSDETGEDGGDPSDGDRRSEPARPTQIRPVATGSAGRARIAQV
jgi:hypothetical protein